MTTLEMKSSDTKNMLWHMALLGMGAILEDAGLPDVRLSWSGGMTPRCRVHTPHGNPADLASAILQHAAHRSSNSWIQKDAVLPRKNQGLMSPRITRFVDNPQVRPGVFTQREEVLDDLMHKQEWLDLRFLAALGEPCYWSKNDSGQVLQDDGASRLEMQPRNQGSEFVRSRLRKLAEAVAKRDELNVLAGLTGQSIRDEAGNDETDSRTGTGFTNPGPVDNAVAWCALWGISQLPTIPRVNHTAVTSGHVGNRRKGESFYLPYWTARWRPARVRTIVSSAALEKVAHSAMVETSAAEVEDTKAREWLAARGVRGIVCFPIEEFGSKNAPERRAMLGRPLPMLKQ